MQRLRPGRKSLASLAASLVIALVAVGWLALSRSGAEAAGAGDCSPSADWGTLRPDLGAAVLRLVNAHRAQMGRAPLAVSATLQRAAQWKSLHMGHFGYLQHSDPAPPLARSVGERLAACGYRGSAYGENIAFGYPTAAAVVQGWLSSPGHRANIESAGYTHIGIAAARGSRGLMTWTQNFGRESGASSAPPPAAAPSHPASRRPAIPPRRIRDTRTLEAGRLVRRALRPRAGRKFTTRIAVVVRASHERVSAGRVRCRARTGGQPVWVGVHRFRRGLATCTFRLPPWARGTYVAGTIRVSARGATVTRWFSRKVR